MSAEFKGTLTPALSHPMGEGDHLDTRGEFETADKLVSVGC